MQAKVVAEGTLGDIAANVDHMSLPRGKKGMIFPIPY